MKVDQTSRSYQFFMLVLCLYALAVVAAQTATALDPEVQAILDYADYVVCLLFFVDFLFSLWSAPNRWQYLKTWGWLDLLSSIPMLDAARWGRIARVTRIIRVIRAIRTTKVLTAAFLRQRAESAYLAASLAALLLIVFCSIGILHFEDDPESNIRTAEDAIWWAFTTITTVGYGDRFPVTTEGRFVASLLMFAGVGLFSTFSGFLAAWLLLPEKDEHSDLIAVKEEIATLRKLLEARDK